MVLVGHRWLRARLVAHRLVEVQFHRLGEHTFAQLALGKAAARVENVFAELERGGAIDVAVRAGESLFEDAFDLVVGREVALVQVPHQRTARRVERAADDALGSAGAHQHLAPVVVAVLAPVQLLGHHLAVHVVPVVREVHVRVEFYAAEFARDFVEGAMSKVLEVAPLAVEQSLAVGAFHDGVEALLGVQVRVEIVHVLVAVQTQVGGEPVFVDFDQRFRIGLAGSDSVAVGEFWSVLGAPFGCRRCRLQEEEFN